MKRVMFATVLAVAFAAGSVAAQQPASSGTQASGVMNLGTVRITRNVTADGKPLPAGSYQVRLTAEEAKPEVAGQDKKLERWAEFVRGGQVRGREVVSIVPQDEIASVADGRPPRPGSSKVELLKGNDYLRVWINRGGNHYLIHLPTGASATD
ncbi:MAG TPA: hypothetical protein VK886_10120 [Vicinamibacterales bacterium]|nr:hypothetical protein [Vicinamibacterales bacterium]